MTDAIETGARALIQQVDQLVGAARAFERGFFQEAIAQSAYQLQKEQESGERIVVGVNRFTDHSPPVSISSPDFSALETQQRTRLAETKRQRNSSAVQDALAELGRAARGSDPLMPSMV